MSILCTLIPLAALFSSELNTGPWYAVLSVQVSIAQVCRAANHPPPTIRITEGTGSITSAFPPNEIAINGWDQFMELSSGERYAAIAREVAALKTYAVGKEAAISSASKVLFRLSREYPTIGPWSRQARLQSLKMARGYLIDLGVSEVCLLTLLEQERANGELNYPSLHQDIADVSLTELIGSLRDALTKQSVKLDRSRFSNYFRVTTRETDDFITFSILNDTIFSVPRSSVASDFVVQRLDKFFDGFAQLSHIRTSDNSLLLDGEILVSFPSEGGMEAAERARYGLIAAVLRHKWQTGWALPVQSWSPG